MVPSRSEGRGPPLPHGAPQALCACVDPAASLLAYPPPGIGGPGCWRPAPVKFCAQPRTKGSIVLRALCLLLFVVPPTHCVTLIRDSSDRGLIARVSSLVCRVINRDSLPHAIGYILLAWSTSSFMRPCGPSSVSVGLPPTGDRGVRRLTASPGHVRAARLRTRWFNLCYALVCICLC